MWGDKRINERREKQDRTITTQIPNRNKHGTITERHKLTRHIRINYVKDSRKLGESENKNKKVQRRFHRNLPINHLGYDKMAIKNQWNLLWGNWKHQKIDSR